MRLKALHGLAASLLAAGELDGASELVDEAAFLAREIGDDDEIAAGILLLAELAVASRDLDHADKLLGRFLELGARAGRWQHPREHEARLLLGRVQHALGKLDHAHAVLSETLERTRLEHRVWSRARCAQALATLEHERGELDAAGALYEEARARTSPHAADRAALAARRPAAISPWSGPRTLGRASPLLPAGPSGAAGASRRRTSRPPTLHRGPSQLAEASQASGDLRVVLAARALLARCGRGDALTFELDRERRVLYLPGGDVVDLGRRGPIRRILEELIARRTAGAYLRVDEAFEAGWPDQRVASDAAANRVYNAISVLRSCGLGDSLEGGSEGYRLAPGDRWVTSDGR